MGLAESCLRNGKQSALSSRLYAAHLEPENVKSTAGCGFAQPCKICRWILSRRTYRLRKLDPILQSSTFVQISAPHMSRQRERQQCL